jgi:hypothetical protein
MTKENLFLSAFEQEKRIIFKMMVIIAAMFSTS